MENIEYIEAYQTALLDWYKSNHRKLPWRETQDPYKIWISEIMLQQTQVDTVIAYFNRFTEKFPTVFDLATAEEDAVFKLWEGLGYYSRARNIMKCARLIVERYKGEFPCDHGKLLELPGIGPYTAGAIYSIAFNKKAPAVDGNVMRVFARQLNIDLDIALPATRKVIESFVTERLPEDVRHFNQALMELGATICTPKNPSCESCPVAEFCTAKRLDLQSVLPYKSKKAKQTVHQMAIAYVRSEGDVLIVKRAGEGLLANLWAYPILEVKSEADGVAYLLDELKEVYDLKELTYMGVYNQGRHVFTHRVWDMTVHEFSVGKKSVVDYPQMLWVSEIEQQQYAFPTAFRKLWK